MPLKKPLIFGLSGTSLKAEEKGLFIANPVFGFILFRRNIESAKQLLELTTELKNLYPHDPALIFVDQEGGRVARLKPPIINSRYPAAGTFEDKDAVRKNYKNLMTDLKQFNIDSPCAPVADLRYTYTDNVIGDRSFGSDPAKVAEFVQAAIEGITEAGGIAIIKHMPGHGRATSDSHEELPIVDAPLEDLIETDFKVFKELANAPQYAMTAHIKFPALDPNYPATLSKIVIDFIREKIGFKGKILTDAIEMKALHQNIDTKNPVEFIPSLIQVAINALAAGCDYVLHCTGKIDEMRAIIDAVQEPIKSNMRICMTYSAESNQEKYPFFLPDLPFNKEAFRPHFSSETFDYHHGKHHKTYVENLNKLLLDKPKLHNKSLEEIIVTSSNDSALTGIFNNAAQIWNHNFFWHSITPHNGGGKPAANILKQIEKDFSTFEDFSTKFKEAATSQFGSGWAWLVFNKGKLEIKKTPNAATPITENLYPILTCDVWEHAYYIDYRNKRPDYVETYIKHMINWKFAEQNLHNAMSNAK